MKVKTKNIESISKTINKNGFPKPKKVICSKCRINEFYIKFVISRLAYSQKHNWGYWCEDESKRDQEWCSQCLRQIFYEDKENYNGGIVWDEKSEEQFKKGELKGNDNLNEQYEQLNKKPKEDSKEELNEQQELTEEQKNLLKVISLVVKAEQALKNNDLKEVAEMLEQIKKYANNEYLKSSESLTKSVRDLQQAFLLEQQKQKQKQKPSQQPPAPRQQNEYDKQISPAPNYWLIAVIYSIIERPDLKPLPN